jgi:hypothetical protein
MNSVGPELVASERCTIYGFIRHRRHDPSLVAGGKGCRILQQLGISRIMTGGVRGAIG